MIETVVALLMFINGEIKEHRIQDNMAACLRASVKQKELFQNPYLTNAYVGKAKTEIYMGEKSIKSINIRLMKKANKKRNPVAKQLRHFKRKVIKNKRIYDRKNNKISY